MEYSWYVRDASDSTPAVYQASGSITFAGEFESGVTDEFEAIPNAGGGTGSSAAAGRWVYTGGGSGQSNSATYRYGFNGKENDQETNTQDYGMCIYDPRVGRFLSVDPLAKAYSMLTPYQFASNRPIDGIDQDGTEWKKIVSYVLATI